MPLLKSHHAIAAALALLALAPGQAPAAGQRQDRRVPVSLGTIAAGTVVLFPVPAAADGTNMGTFAASWPQKHRVPITVYNSSALPFGTTLDGPVSISLSGGSGPRRDIAVVLPAGVSATVAGEPRPQGTHDASLIEVVIRKAAK